MILGEKNFLIFISNLLFDELFGGFFEDYFLTEYF